MIKNKIYLFVVVSLLVLSCVNNEKNNNTSNLYEFLPCMDPVSPCGIEYHTINIYRTPEYLDDVFSFVINEEKKCICYDKSYTVFSLYFQNTIENRIELAIYSVSNVLKENLSYEIFGAFYYDNHYFLIANNYEVDGFEYLTNFSIAKFIIKKKNNEFPDIDDSKSEFVFLGQQNSPDWKLIHHFECQKNE